jgi:DUF438 domain-containing protein
MDPVVTEVRKNRDLFAAKFKYDIKAIICDVQKREKKSGHKIVFLNRNKKNRPTKRLHSV